MPSMRVHELAKEFGLTSKEMLAKLEELKIPAKNHASTLAEAYVDRIRKAMGPELAAHAAEVEKQRLEEEAKKEAEEKEAARLAAEERRAAEKAERARREAERAAREVADAGAAAGEAIAIDTAEPAEQTEEPAAKAAPKPAPVAPVFDGLLSQLDEANKRLAEQQRAEEAERAAQREKMVAEFLSPGAKGKGKKASSPTPSVKRAAPAPAPAAGLNIISEAPAPKAAKGKKGAKHEFEPVVPELEQDIAVDDMSEDERYRKMAAAAEQLQKDKVLEEARAAVAAAQGEGEGRRKKKKEKRAKEKAEKEAAAPAEEERGSVVGAADAEGEIVAVETGINVGSFAEALDVPANDIIKRLFMLGTPLTVNQPLNDELIEIIADDLGRSVRITSPEEENGFTFTDDEADLKPRPPVVTVMGHVDHGKTSLLDAIRSSGVAEHEAGGITQHIGASVVDINDRQITFIDTPGHEAFTAMRARGAKVTDVVVLVVAADDGVMPQTIEAIDHAKAAGVPIVVAVNKIDKDGANPDRVRQELTEHEIIPEEWGGQNMFVNVSAKKGIGIEDLLETIILQADVLELKANPDTTASGFVIEANLDKGRGPIATVVVQRGTLRPGDALVAGMTYGRVRALVDPRGNQVTEAKPADPVEILGLSSVPAAGDEFAVFEKESDARALAEQRETKHRLREQEKKVHISLDNLFEHLAEGEMKELNLVVKADVVGAIEALKDALGKMDQSEVRINVIHGAVGGITETDVMLADASNAIIIGFNVRPSGQAKQVAEKEKVDIRTYRVIYQAIEDINAARIGMLSPDIVEQETATVEVRDLFRVPKMGVIAGSYVTNGEISRDDQVRIVRDGTVIYEGKIGSLRRFKDDVKSVKAGYECGIGIDGYQDLKEGDIIESFRTVEVAREA